MTGAQHRPATELSHARKKVKLYEKGRVLELRKSFGVKSKVALLAPDILAC